MRRVVAFLLLIISLFGSLCACEPLSEATSPDELWQSLQNEDVDGVFYSQSIFDSDNMILLATEESDSEKLKAFCHSIVTHCQKPVWQNPDTSDDSGDSSSDGGPFPGYGEIWLGNMVYSLNFDWRSHTLSIRQNDMTEEQEQEGDPQDWVATFDDDLLAELDVLYQQRHDDLATDTAADGTEGSAR